MRNSFGNENETLSIDYFISKELNEKIQNIWNNDCEINEKDES